VRKAGLFETILEPVLTAGLDLGAQTGNEIRLVGFPGASCLPGDLLEVDAQSRHLEFLGKELDLGRNDIRVHRATAARAS